ncbi:MAG: VIT domain-containing protein, partial [Proteobacteria bacterium]|nr:VIT domain-containing protein [Pseudomonadota bacterium]
MQGTAFGHRLETLNDGLNTFANGERIPMPLIATDVHVQVLAGAALVTTMRRFRNAEQVPIEAIMTFPVGFDAVATGLAATINGRRMVGVAQEKAEARETYEAALDEGRMSVLHEEALRGIHILSVGALPSGAEVCVELEQVVPLTEVSGKQFLRLPMTAGQLYGNSPLLPADDLVTAASDSHEATLQVTVELGHVYLDGAMLPQGEQVGIPLNRSLEMVIEGGSFGLLTGRAADGRAVSLSFRPTHGHDASLDLHVLVDRSGSTQSHVGRAEVSIWQAIRDGLSDVLRVIRPSDQISLWQFDSACQFLGTARGEACAKLTNKLQLPEGGTELAVAVHAAIAAEAKDILVLTDGQTWAHIVEDLKSEAVRISAILVGSGSLDANVGHLCALTGGQVFYAPDQDVSSPLKSALEALRTPGDASKGQMGETGPEHVVALRGGITIEANWTADQNLNGPFSADAVGRFAAALAIPILGAEQTQAWACAHGLCTHATSLILVDEVSQPTEGFSQMRKVPLMQVGGGAAAGKPTP